MSFNSPVWFNVGVEEHPQCSACFINSVGDSMDSILKLAHTEGMLFKYGSGAGSNLSKIRSSKERLSGGGEASGPVSFMRGFDAFAGVIKSGGKTRRAAKMVILDADHPDVAEFVTCKADEEKKAWSLIDAGYDGGFNVKGGAYDSVFFQNANHSIRVTDAFMRAVLEDREWALTSRLDGKAVETVRARDLMQKVTEAAWLCGDPGMQFDTTINAWHTCPESDRINASNPCSEYMFLDDTACNLASLNLMHFRAIGGGFDVDSFRRAVDLTILAQEILVSNAKYPTAAIGKNSEEYRPLGLGYANLGALLMASRPPVRLRRRARLRRRDHRAHDGRGVRDERAHRRADGPVRRLRAEPRAVPRGRSASTRSRSIASTRRSSSASSSRRRATPGPTRSAPAWRAATATPR